MVESWLYCWMLVSQFIFHLECCQYDRTSKYGVDDRRARVDTGMVGIGYWMLGMDPWGRG